jgi:hypothetical protein
VPGVHATLHDVTVAIVVVGIVACVVRIVVIVVIKTGAKESTGKEPSPMVEAAMEAAVCESASGKAATLPADGAGRRRTREAAAKVSAADCGRAKASAADSGCAKSAAAEASSKSAAVATAEATSKSATTTAVATATSKSATTTAMATTTATAAMSAKRRRCRGECYC